MKITLCGSARFEAKFHEVNRKLTLAGHVVHALSSYPSIEGTKDWYGPAEKEVLDLAHLAKIEESDAVFVIDCNGPGEAGYVGESTRREMRWAHIRAKLIYRLSKDGTLTSLIMSHGPLSRAEFAEGYSDATKGTDWKSR